MMELADYHFTLHHKPGKLMVKGDLMSWRADHNKGEADNEGLVLLKGEWFRRQEQVIEGEEKEIMDRIRRNWGNKDKVVKRALMNHEADWVDDGNGVITWKGRVYVSRDKPLREQIIRINHDRVSAGHPGRYKTHKLIMRDYWWPRIQGNVKVYVEGCETCQRTKPRHGKLAAPL